MALDLDTWAPSLLSFCIAALVSLVDLFLASGDRIKCPVHPLYTWEGRVFVFVNGSVAVIIYFVFLGKSQLLEGYHIPVGVKWGTDSLWSKAGVIGLFAIVLIRSNFLSLKENKIIGFDKVYTHCRDNCIDSLFAATLVKRRRIRARYRERFLDDPTFTKDFGEFLSEMMEHKKAKPVDLRLLKELINGPSTDLVMVHEALIKSALLYMSRRRVRHLLQEWREHTNYEEKPRFWRRADAD